MLVRSTCEAFVVSTFKVCISWVEPRLAARRIQINSIQNMFCISSSSWQFSHSLAKGLFSSSCPPSVCVLECTNSAPTGPNIREISIWGILLKSINKVCVYLKYDKKYIRPCSSSSSFTTLLIHTLLRATNIAQQQKREFIVAGLATILIFFVFRYAIYKTVAIPILALRIIKTGTPQCYIVLVLPVLFLISIKNL